MGKPERSSVLPAIPWVMSSAGWAGIDLLQFAAGQADPDAEPGGDDQKPPIIADPVRLDRRRWAMLIKRIYQADPLLCPKCGGTMKIKPGAVMLNFGIDRAGIGCCISRGRLGDSLRGL